MKTLFARNILPSRFDAALWGYRKQWGLAVNEQDPCWQEWQRTYLDFYQANQREGIGTMVNDAGYRIMAKMNLTGKTVLEIGPGDIRHFVFWQNRPAAYVLADIHQTMLEKATDQLQKTEIPTLCLHMQRGQTLPLADSSMDIVVSFYSLEQIYPLAPYLQDLKRVLRPDGVIAGAIPAEGGMAWGGEISYLPALAQKKHQN